MRFGNEINEYLRLNLVSFEIDVLRQPLAREDKNRAQMDASDSELSEGSEVTNEELDSCEAGGEDSKIETPPTPQVCTSKRRPSEKYERCSCGKGNSSFQLNSGAFQIQCMYCGREALNTNPRDTTKFDKSTANPGPSSTVHQDNLLNVFTQSYAGSLAFLPDTSLEDEACCGSQQVEPIVSGRVRSQHWQKTPVDDVCELSVQVPSPGMAIRIFLLERTYPERNEKRFFLYMIPEGKCEVYEEICRDFKEASVHQGFSRQIPFTVNSGRSQDFHTVYIQERITVAFEIENRFQENFVALNQRNESDFRVPLIKSDSQSRLAKGTKCQFMVQYVGEPGTLCQEQGKITLTIDSADQTTMFFSISIWSSVDIHVEEDQPEEQYI